MKKETASQCIVLPFQENPDTPFGGTGIALHFLLGNVMVLHTDLKECWFGWRVKKLFSSPEDLKDYCTDSTISFDLNTISQEQNVRFWLSGSRSENRIAIRLYDGRSNTISVKSELLVTPKDGLVGFRSDFLDMLKTGGIPFPDQQTDHAMWPEKISDEGLDAMGRALLEFYGFSAFSQNEKIDLDPFSRAVETAPDSFMALDLFGWALYRNKDYNAAVKVFLKALEINPFGAGAMAGLVWCGVFTGDKDLAVKWAGRKAETRNEDINAAIEKILLKFEG